MDVLDIELKLLIHSFTRPKYFGRLLLAISGLAGHYKRNPWALKAYQESQIVIVTQQYHTLKYVAATLCDRQHGLTQLIHDNGNVVKSINFRHGLLHGEERSYFDDGKIKFIKTHKNNLQHGKYESWIGGIHEIQFYELNKKHGKHILWNEAGRIISIATFVNGEISGRLRKWYGNGQLVCDAIYNKGKPVGEIIPWSRNGQMMRRYSYIDGKKDGLCEFWYTNGNKYEAIEYKDGLRHGEMKEWNFDGELSTHINYHYGLLHGSNITDIEEGKITNVDFYQMGISCKKGY